MCLCGPGYLLPGFPYLTVKNSLLNSDANYNEAWATRSPSHSACCKFLIRRQGRLCYCSSQILVKRDIEIEDKRKAQNDKRRCY